MNFKERDGGEDICRPLTSICCDLPDYIVRISPHL